MRLVLPKFAFDASKHKKILMLLSKPLSLCCHPALHKYWPGVPCMQQSLTAPDEHTMTQVPEQASRSCGAAGTEQKRWARNRKDGHSLTARYPAPSGAAASA